MRVAIVDDQDLVRQGIEELLGLEPTVEVVFTAASGPEALDQLEQQPIDVVIMDIRMPGQSGIDTLQALRARGDTTPVLMLTTFDDPELLLQATDAGAQGFMLKDTSPEELVAATKTLHQGGVLLMPIPAEKIRARYNYAENLIVEAVSERELDVLRLMAGGYSNREIASALHLAEGTIKNYVSEILLKLDARDRTQAVLKAITLHIV